MHSLEPLQVEPSAFLATQLGALHQKPDAQLASVVHEAGQVALAPSHTYGLQLGLPAEPAGTLEQVPSVPVRLHASQAAPQALLQQ